MAPSLYGGLGLAICRTASSTTPPDEISFRTQDHKLKQEVVTRYNPAEFIDHLASHVLDHYKHAIRHFGLLSPRTKGRTFGALFAQLGEVRRQKPRRIAWASSIDENSARTSLSRMARR